MFNTFKYSFPPAAIDFHWFSSNYKKDLKVKKPSNTWSIKNNLIINANSDKKAVLNIKYFFQGNFLISFFIMCVCV